jgi:hypothetical protein
MFFLLLTSYLLLLSSCTTENKFARNFIKNRNSIDVIVLKPDFVIKSNLKEDSVQQLTTLSQEEKDSIGIVKSIFLKNVNDSALIEAYYQNTVDELKGFGFNVITDTLSNQFYKNDSLYYIFNISQLELDENSIPYEDEIQDDTAMYIQSFELNEVALDTWIESSVVRKAERKSKVLYAEHTANDAVNGGFERDFFEGNINYKYKIDKLTDDDIYKLASYSAKKNASYYFDYLMNKYIRGELKKTNSLPANVYFHYNRFYNYLVPSNKERFTIIK